MAGSRCPLPEPRAWHSAFVKVKGHATQAEVRSGKVRREDKEGNDAADTLARRGARQHRLNERTRARLIGCKRLATSVQHMMCDIIIARNLHSGHCLEGGAEIVEVPSDDDEVIGVSSEEDDVLDLLSEGGDDEDEGYVDDWHARRLRDPG